MNCVGIDVSKGKSMIAVMRPLGEMVIPPFEVGHTDAELCELSRRLRDLDGETRIVMEATGNYQMFKREKKVYLELTDKIGRAHV